MSTLSIGDFSRATHLGVKALRDYHRRGLLVPAEVDELTGYRRYGVEQIGDALLIKRFRELDLPLDRIRVLLQTESVEERTRLLEDHLSRMIGDLERMRSAAANLSGLLQPAVAAGPVEVRVAPAARGAAIAADVGESMVTPWFRGAMAELQATLVAQHVGLDGPVLGLFDQEVFTHGSGRAVVFAPTGHATEPLGRVAPMVTERAELAVIVHRGSHSDVDRSYGALGAHVARHEISRPGPVRETYIVGPFDTADEDEWITEIGWPVFHTRA